MHPAVLGPGKQVVVHLSPTQGAVYKNQIKHYGNPWKNLK
jgi:hypothetical protein